MINKQSTFIHPSVVVADKRALLVAHQLEKELSRLAINVSLYPEHPASGMEVADAFTAAGYLLFHPNKEDSFIFMNAAKRAYRMESSLMVEQKMVKANFVTTPLTLRIKFYRKNDRIEFFVWTMHFGDGGFIHNCTLTDLSSLGCRATS